MSRRTQAKARLIPIVDDSCLRGTETVRVAKASVEALFPYRKDSLCRCGCGEYVLPPAKCWATRQCSENAVESYRLAIGDPATIRRHLWARDNGVCQKCGKDCQLELYREQVKAREAGLSVPQKSLWEAAHLVAVKDGGARRGLDNLITVCRPCHLKLDGKKPSVKSVAQKKFIDN
jgi:5-methylcytosine-specific restriction endonuclease McrA